MNYSLKARNCLREVARVLKVKGRAVIGELYPPMIHTDVNWMPEADYEDMGLTKEVFEGEDFVKFLEENKMNLSLAKIAGADRPFFLVLKKEKKERL